MIFDLIAHDYLHFWGNQEKQAYKPRAEICFRGHTFKNKRCKSEDQSCWQDLEIILLNYLLKPIYSIFSSDNIRSYMDMLQQSGTHLQQQSRTNN